MAVFSLMSALVFNVPRRDVASRLQVSLTLVVTAATYKFTISAMMPHVAYLTLLDKYIIATSAIIALVVFENGVADGAWASDALDELFCHFVLLAWALTHAFFVSKVLKVQAEGVVSDGEDHHSPRVRQSVRVTSSGRVHQPMAPPAEGGEGGEDGGEGRAPQSEVPLVVWAGGAVLCAILWRHPLLLGAHPLAPI